MKCTKNKTLKTLIITAATALFLLLLTSCSTSDPVGVTANSVSGYTMAIRSNPSEIRANGSDTALITVEVWDKNGNYVDGVTVTYSVTLGTLENYTATTDNGVAINTFKSSSRDGMAIVTAAVENIVAKAEIVQYYTTR